MRLSRVSFMISSIPTGRLSRTRICRAVGAGVVAGAMVFWGGASTADPAPYPFEGTWVRADRICSATSPLARTYTAKEISTSNGRCNLRRVAFGSGEFELLEECHRADRRGEVTERIRMLGPDAMIVKHRVLRLKIPHGRRFVRCTIAAPAATPVPASSSPAQKPVAHPASSSSGPKL